jgi:phosphoribosyl-dephospho-CoA transferase
MADLARHTLVYLAPDAWAPLIAPDEPALLRNWAADGRPAIARRILCDDGDAIALGVPLPPALGKRRVALRCAPDAVVRTTPPPLLRDAAAAAPRAWQMTIAALLMCDPKMRCFGSLAWQHLTGLDYLTDTSDIDLILECADPATADARAAKIESIDAAAPMRIDAELVAPDGTAVQWREWRSDAVQILAKSPAAARLVDRTALFA